ncbi:MAG: putative thioredoxin [Parasphingorhabdus sp.]|jgi:putative thioredoxin
MSESPHITIANQENFAEAVIEKSKSVPVLVDFWADWCAPCKNLMPILAKLADEYKGAFHLVKVNTDENQNIAVQLGIRSLPTVKLFKDGQPIDEFTGALPEQSVREFLDHHIKDEIEVFLEQVEQLIESGDRENADAALSQALEQNPTMDRVRMRMVHLKMSDGDTEGAKALLEGVTDETRQSAEFKSFEAQFELVEKAAGAPAELELRKLIEENPDDCKARDQLSMVLYAQQDIEGAMQQLLEIVKRDRTYEEDSGRTQLLKLFEALGNGNPIVQKFRRQLSIVLY